MKSHAYVLAALLVLLTGVMLAVPDALRAAPTAAQPDPLVERGRYLSRIAGCNDCHTEGYLLSEGKVPEPQWLTGAGLGWRGPWGTTYGANLRLFFSTLSEQQWLTLARQLKTRPPMPWFTLNTMEEGDLRALYHFIHSLGPAGNPAPAYVPPGQEPSTPYALFPSPPPQ